MRSSSAYAPRPPSQHADWHAPNEWDIAASLDGRSPPPPASLPSYGIAGAPSTFATRLPSATASRSGYAAPPSSFVSARDPYASARDPYTSARSPSPGYTSFAGSPPTSYGGAALSPPSIDLTLGAQAAADAMSSQRGYSMPPAPTGLAARCVVVRLIMLTAQADIVSTPPAHRDGARRLVRLDARHGRRLCSASRAFQHVVRGPHIAFSDSAQAKLSAFDLCARNRSQIAADACTDSLRVCLRS